MTKKDLEIFLNNERKKVLNALVDSKNKRLNEIEEETYKSFELSAYSEKLFPHIMAIKNILAEMNDNLLSGMRCYTYSPLTAVVRYMNDIPSLEKYLRKNECMIDDVDSKLMKAVREQYISKERSVNDEYDKLIAIVKQYKNAKLASELLKELGFDLSELEKTVIKETSLACPVNTNFLFIREEQHNEN